MDKDEGASMILGLVICSKIMVVLLEVRCTVTVVLSALSAPVFELGCGSVPTEVGISLK